MFSQFARRTLLNNRLTTRGHGHGHHGPEYPGLSEKVQYMTSLSVKLAGCAVFFAYPFLVMKFQHAKKADA
ncbi:hypothetical protein CYY_003790 [Polysphondylium violaceum]|uniref:Uncharacterized protein n=1 Tax=Polysphondylium violaceum TaxID=133409 RepID=A0A8J4PU85_9MYCE|nr:hypothetical protein CYY_003790 [Polysphondylium violaceum]